MRRPANDYEFEDHSPISCLERDRKTLKQLQQARGLSISRGQCNVWDKTSVFFVLCLRVTAIGWLELIFIGWFAINCTRKASKRATRCLRVHCNTRTLLIYSPNSMSAHWPRIIMRSIIQKIVCDRSTANGLCDRRATGLITMLWLVMCVFKGAQHKWWPYRKRMWKRACVFCVCMCV